MVNVTYYGKKNNRRKLVKLDNMELSDKKVIYEPTHKIRGYQLTVLWRYKCKNDAKKWHEAFGFSSKLDSDEYPTKLELEIMLGEADNNAWKQYICSPTTEYRKALYLKKYVPQNPSELNNSVKEVHTKKERKEEFDKLKERINFNLNYDVLIDKEYLKHKTENKVILSKKDFRKKYAKENINKKEYDTLRKIVRKEKIEAEEKPYAKKVKIRNNKIVSLYKSFGGKKDV